MVRKECGFFLRQKINYYLFTIPLAKVQNGLYEYKYMPSVLLNREKTLPIV